MSQENVEIVRRFFDAVERLLEVAETSRSILDAIDAGDIPPEAKVALGYLTPEGNLIARVDEYPERREALEAAELRE